MADAPTVVRVTDFGFGTGPVVIPDPEAEADFRGAMMAVTGLAIANAVVHEARHYIKLPSGAVRRWRHP